MRTKLQLFFEKSFWFWILSKVLIALILFTSFISVLTIDNLKNLEFTLALFALIDAILLLVSLTADFTKNATFLAIKRLSGTFLMITAIAIIIALLFIPDGIKNGVFYLGYPLGLWMLVTGVFDRFYLKSLKQV